MMFKKHLLSVKGNKLFLCSLLGFNESKHILLDMSSHTLVTVGEENQGCHLHRMRQNGGFHNLLGFV